MKIAVTGAGGMLGTALLKALAKHDVEPLPRARLDVTCKDDVRACLAALQPDWVAHCAAFTAVDRAEEESQEAFRVNAEGSFNVAAAAADLGSRFLFFSTDYVFNGELDRPYHESDTTHPINAYGRSKLAGEERVREACDPHLIVRSSWLYGPGGEHFVSKILERARAGSVLRVVEDQQGSPTFTPDLAYMSLLLMEADKWGTFHVTNSDSCSWHGFACRIVAVAGLEAEVQPVHSSTLAVAAARPANSILENRELKQQGIPLLRPWTSALEAFLCRSS